MHWIQTTMSTAHTVEQEVIGAERVEMMVESVEAYWVVEQTEKEADRVVEVKMEAEGTMVVMKVA